MSQLPEFPVVSPLEEKLAVAEPKQVKADGQRDELMMIRRIREGDRELFGELVRPYERAAYAAAYSLLENEAEAEDAAQDAILKAFTKLHQFRGEARFSTWLIRIALNEARSRIRRRATVPMESLEEGVQRQGEIIPREFRDTREIPSETLERAELRRALANAIAKLRQKYREVLILRYVHQLSVAETTQRLGITQSTVKVRLWRARLQLRELLAPALAPAWEPQE